jgi:hypothetical protein
MSASQPSTKEKFSGTLRLGAKSEDESDFPAAPFKIRLTHPHSFIDDNGRHRVWNAGDVITDPAEIEMLTGRKARIEALD